jgi:hypothetical protein
MLDQQRYCNSHNTAKQADMVSIAWQVCEFNSNDRTPEGIKAESREVCVV